jgi:hypothetical protein
MKARQLAGVCVGVATRLRDREVAKRLHAETNAEAAHVILTAES